MQEWIQMKINWNIYKKAVIHITNGNCKIWYKYIKIKEGKYE